MSIPVPSSARAAELRSAVLGLLAVSALVACGPRPDAIREAHSAPVGTGLTVEGYVTVPPGAFESSLGNPGFALQDDSGGVWVKTATKLDFALGQQVRVKGVVGEEAQMRLVDTASGSAEKLSGTAQVAPRDVSTHDVGEATEGRLIRVKGHVSRGFEDDSPYGYKLYVDDGTGEIQIYVNTGTGLTAARLQALTVGQAVEVVGLSSQYESTYEVDPRQPSDLTVE